MGLNLNGLEKFVKPSFHCKNVAQPRQFNTDEHKIWIWKSIVNHHNSEYNSSLSHLQ